MGWVAPRTWVDGEVITAGHLNVQVRDNLRALYGPLAYAEVTEPVPVTSSNGGAPTTILTAPPVTCDGVTPIAVEWFAPHVSAASGNVCMVRLYDGQAPAGAIAYMTAAQIRPVWACARLLPAAGEHVYSVRAWVYPAPALVAITAGAGGPGEFLPSFLRVRAR